MDRWIGVCSHASPPCKKFLTIVRYCVGKGTSSGLTFALHQDVIDSRPSISRLYLPSRRWTFGVRMDDVFAFCMMALVSAPCMMCFGQPMVPRQLVHGLPVIGR